MKSKEYIKSITLSSVIICGVCLSIFVYNASANDTEKIDEMENHEISEDVVGDESEYEDLGSGSEVNEEVNKDEIKEESESEVNNGVEDVVLENEVIIENVSDEVEDVVSEENMEYLVKVDNTLPKKVGMDVSKNNSSTEMPLLPGFKNINGTYICELNNLYGTVIEVYEINEDGLKKIIIKTGSEVEKDSQIQSVVKILLDYYSGKKWEFIYRGVSSYFEITL